MIGISNPGVAQCSRRDMVIVLVLAIGLFMQILAAPAGAVPDDSAPPARDIVWGPWITGTSPTGTVIHVKTSTPEAVTVRYSTDKEFLATGTYRYLVTENGSSSLHAIPLKGLLPGTRYHYQVLTEGDSTGDCHFLTFPIAGPVSFIVYGDSRDQIPLVDQNVRHRLVAGQIAREQDIAFVLHTGDILTEGNSLSDWDRFFAAAGIMLANATFVPVRGNHEQDSPIWEEVFGTVPVYSFESGPAHVTILNSNDNVWNRLGCETTWTRDDLMTERTWKFVALHHPLYSSEEKHVGGFRNLRDAWENLFIGMNVTAVFQGHVHVYERDQASGVMYITEGRGGSPFYALNATKIRSWQASRENSLGYTRIDLDPGQNRATATVFQVADYTDEDTIRLPRTMDETIVERFDLPSPHTGGVGQTLPGLSASTRHPGVLPGLMGSFPRIF